MVFALVAGAWGLIRLLDLVVWRRMGVKPPRLLVNLVDLLIWLLAAGLITSWVFHAPVTGLLATSGVAVATVGFAMKSLISDMFSGIALTLERPFVLGDWVELGDGLIGQVLQISWRTTSVLQVNGAVAHVPNGRMAESTVRVFKRWRDEIDVELGYEVEEARAERLLLSAAAGLPDLGPDHAADVRIVALGANSIKWRLRFWVGDYPGGIEMREQVQRGLMRAFHLADVAVAPTVQRVALERGRAAAGDGVAFFLARCSFFKALTQEEIGALAAGLSARHVTAGTRVVAQGALGTSLFLVREGVVDVSTAERAGTVASLQPGAFFGEASLLTGAPRGASVVARTDSVVIEIGRERLAPILVARPELAAALAAALTARLAQNERVVTAVVEDREVDLLGRVRAFFGLA